jgi:DNA-binding PucR family transcriptional regulator
MAHTDTQLAALAGRIDRDELAATMLGSFRTDIPGYARLPDSAVRGQILEVIRQNVDLCLDWVAGGRPPESARFDEFSESAKNRATEGMPLEDLLRAYRMGATAAWRVLVTEATAEERDALPRAAELIMNYLDQVSGIVASAYLEERQDLVSEHERGLRALLDALLRGDALDAGHHETASRLGLGLSGTFLTFAAAIPGEDARSHARAAARLRAAGALAVTEGDRVVGLSSASRDVASVLPADAVSVIDGAVAREELGASLGDVRLGIEIAVRATRTGVLPLQTLTLDLLLARAPRTSTDLCRRVLDPLGRGSGSARGDLLPTVATYVTLRRDRRRTAERLHIHPNTLDHRLRRARELTGLDLDDPEDLATMVLALHAAR